MARMIDADALKEIIGECPENWTDSPEEIAEFNMWHRIMDDIDSTPTVGDWISVEDRLPEKNGVDLAYYDRTCVSSVYYEKGRAQSEWTDDYEGYCDFDVTHWMPLPEPPKEVQE